MITSAKIHDPHLRSLQVVFTAAMMYRLDDIFLSFSLVDVKFLIRCRNDFNFSVLCMKQSIIICVRRYV